MKARCSFSVDEHLNERINKLEQESIGSIEIHQT